MSLSNFSPFAARFPRSSALGTSQPIAPQLASIRSDVCVALGLARASPQLSCSRKYPFATSRQSHRVNPSGIRFVPGHSILGLLASFHPFAIRFRSGPRARPSLQSLGGRCQ